MAKSIPGQIPRSSCNVFADMGLPDAAELNTKARLGAALNLIVERQRLTQTEVATALGINQPKVTALLNYKLGRLFRRVLDALSRGTRTRCRDRRQVQAKLPLSPHCRQSRLHWRLGALRDRLALRLNRGRCSVHSALAIGTIGVVVGLILREVSKLGQHSWLEAPEYSTQLRSRRAECKSPRRAWLDRVG
jgi:predicted XRE-type DNA-binding protein